MGKIIKAEKRGGGIESKVIEEYTPLVSKKIVANSIHNHGMTKHFDR